MIFIREYHNRWFVEMAAILNFVDSPFAKYPSRKEEWALAVAILQETKDSMPNGIDSALLQRITGADEADLLALQTITTTTPVSHKFTLTDGRCEWLAP
jgi:hypothetical protein